MMGPSFSLRLICVRVFFTITEIKLGQKWTVTCHTATSCQTLEEESTVIHFAITAKDRNLSAVREHDLSEVRQDSQCQGGT